MAYKDFYCPKKIQINNLIVDFVEHYIESIEHIIVLDGDKMQTTNILLDNGIGTKNTIFVPEIDPINAKIHKRSGKCVSYNMKLSELLKNKYILDNTNIAFLDFMCSVEGDYTKNKIYPLSDLSAFLNGTNHATVVCGLTFSQRGNKKLIENDSMETQIKKDFLEPCIASCHYEIFEEKCIKYRRKGGSSMIFILYCLTYNPKITNNIFLWEHKKIGNVKRKVCPGYAP